jgi:hypothetical protein
MNQPFYQGEKSTELPNSHCYKAYFCYAVKGVRDDYRTECPSKLSSKINYVWRCSESSGDPRCNAGD